MEKPGTIIYDSTRRFSVQQAEDVNVERSSFRMVARRPMLLLIKVISVVQDLYTFIPNVLDKILHLIIPDEVTSLQATLRAYGCLLCRSNVFL